MLDILCVKFRFIVSTYVGFAQQVGGCAFLKLLACLAEECCYCMLSNLWLKLWITWFVLCTYCWWASSEMPRVVECFEKSWSKHVDSVTLQTQHHSQQYICTPEEYIVTRRDNVGAFPCFAILEQTLELDLPHEVMDHPYIQSLNNYDNVRFLLSSYRVSLLMVWCTGHGLLQEGIPFWRRRLHRHHRNIPFPNLLNHEIRADELSRVVIQINVP